MKKLRHELKFYINISEYELLREKLQIVLKRDKHTVNDEGYHIRSLYFDNVYDNDLYEKNYGIYRRKKFRIRIYNHSDSVIKLEKKNRFGEMINKESLSISKDEYQRLLEWDYDFLQDKNNQTAKDFYLYMRTQHMSPKVIVDYVREAYMEDIEDVRITFDKYLSAGVNSVDIFEKNLVTVEALKYPFMIMEVKFNSYLPDYIRDILQLDSHHRSAISKYVICREQSMMYYKQ
ncbi:polyphosphate polymerase domain-containing protein [Lysinibacillus telephonicus]|uniref:Polyphosphate polymerase domain-containing protein n=1 Tax=Lysinibacillus telephonicus TaxID=1714840 RepID=A0A431UVT4_9BACI|nr:polyphosphate polymerase domain-containing protein [Lysinibacillus telephonicus]RTQ95066.1 polyphosphate polymerase domain-containing protein [Lysinibacillus telephonicus]